MNKSNSDIAATGSPKTSALRSAPVGLRVDLPLLLVPGILWYFAIHSRTRVIMPRCGLAPSQCTPDQVFLLDRISLGIQYRWADHWSFITQDATGYLAVLVPLALGLYAYRRLGVSARRAAFQTLMDWLILTQAVAWNGLLDELARLWVQRPRPFVYTDPVRLGFDAAHYTSFYSGHTSFSAAAAMTLVATNLGHAAPTPFRRGTNTIAVLLVIATGILRVLAGRHFITDVLAGALMGALTAWAISRLHRAD